MHKALHLRDVRDIVYVSRKELKRMRTLQHWVFCRCITTRTRGARGVMVIVVGNGHGNSSSNPGRE